jgi:hypothetical protein
MGIFCNSLYFRDGQTIAELSVKPYRADWTEARCAGYFDTL